MSIKLDHSAKVALLEAIRAGEIDEALLRKLGRNEMTAAEVEAELDRLCKVMHESDCQRLQRLGFCPFTHGSTPPHQSK